MAVLKDGDKAETEDMARLHIREIVHSTVQYHLPTKDVQVISLCPLLDHTKGHPGHPVPWVYQPVESGVIATLAHLENLIHQKEEAFIQVLNMFKKEDKTKIIQQDNTIVVIFTSNVNQIEITIVEKDLVIAAVITHYKVLTVDHP